MVAALQVHIRVTIARSRRLWSQAGVCIKAASSERLFAGPRFWSIRHDHSMGNGSRSEFRVERQFPVIGGLAVALLIACASAGPAWAHDEEVRSRLFGFLPVVSTEQLVRRFEPLVDYLAGEMEVPIEFETAPTYTDFVRRTHKEQRYDYLFTAPHFYFLAQRRAGYRVVARVDGELLRSAIVVRRDSGISDLRQLCGGTVATPSRMALITVLIRERLIEAGCKIGEDTTLVPTPSHNASLMSVYRRATDAAGLGTVPFGRADAEIREALLVVAETAGTPNMPFSVAPWVSDDEASRFANALMKLNEDGEGSALLEHLGWPGFARAEPEDYDVFESYTLPIND